jgi:hypothetical protein
MTRSGSPVAARANGRLGVTARLGPSRSIPRGSPVRTERSCRHSRCGRDWAVLTHATSPPSFDVDVSRLTEPTRTSPTPRARPGRIPCDERCRPSGAPSGAAAISRKRSDSPARRCRHRFGAASCQPPAAPPRRTRCRQAQATAEARFHRPGASPSAAQVLSLELALAGVIATCDLLPPGAPSDGARVALVVTSLGSVVDDVRGQCPRRAAASSASS